MSSLFSTSGRMRTATHRPVPMIVLATILCTLCGVSIAADTPLTLYEAQRLAIERSRLLPAKDLAAAASRDMAVAASQLPDPVLKLGVENLPVEGADRFTLGRDFMTMRRVGVMQDFTRAEKRHLRAERYEREAVRSAAEKELATVTIRRDTAMAWLDRYFAEAMAAVVTEQIEQAKLDVRAAEGAYRAGRGTQADIFRAKSALVQFDDRASEMERRVVNARIMLARWIGAAADLQLAETPATASIAVDETTLETRFAHHPEVTLLGTQEDIAATDAKLARANKKADWSVELAFQQRGPAYSNMVSFGVSVPLQWNQKNRQDRELRASLALVEEARAEREDALRGHVAETRAMISEWRNKRERLARYERELVPLARSATQAALAAYRGAKASLPDVLNARLNEIGARLQVLQLEAETARLWAQLNFLFPQDALPAYSPRQKNQEPK